MPAFFSRSYYCDNCDVAYNDKYDHRCEKSCPSCYKSPQCIDENGEYCKTCNRYFRSKTCFNNHKLEYIVAKTGQSSSVCDRIQRCKSCKKHILRANLRQHRCGFYKCNVCKEEVKRNGHFCHIQPIDSVQDEVAKEMNLIGEDLSDNENNNTKKKGKDEEIIQRFVFFDFETMQNKVYDETKYGMSYQHEPNLCVVKVTCDDCRKRDFESDCSRCRMHSVIFKGQNCVEDFCKFLFNKTMINTTAIAHNAKGFDSHFILNYLQKQGIKPKIICQGNLKYFFISFNFIKYILLHRFKNHADIGKFNKNN